MKYRFADNILTIEPETNHDHFVIGQITAKSPCAYTWDFVNGDPTNCKLELSVEMIVSSFQKGVAHE